MARQARATRRKSLTVKQFEKAAERNGRQYVLQLYVTGMTPKSSLAIENIKAICEEFLSGRNDLQVIDIYQNPVLSRIEQIVAAPTLIKKLPKPSRRLVGDMSSRERVLLGLDLRLN